MVKRISRFFPKEKFEVRFLVGILNIFVDQHHLIHNSNKKKVYIERWIYSGIPGTVVGWKKELPVYPDCPQGEDVPFMHSLENSVLYGMPWLYTYCYHGKNTFNIQHHMKQIDLYSVASICKNLDKKECLIKADYDFKPDFFGWYKP